MAASISSVTLMGFGNGTFNGSANLLPTIGYGIGAAAVIQPVDGWRTQTRKRRWTAETRPRLWIAGSR